MDQGVFGKVSSGQSDTASYFVITTVLGYYFHYAHDLEPHYAVHISGW